MVFSPNAPRVEVDAPPLSPLPFGLYSTATVIDTPVDASGEATEEDLRWQLGYHYRSNALCGAQTRVWAAPCDSLTVDRNPPVPVTITVALTYGPAIPSGTGTSIYPVLAQITPNPTTGLPAEMVVQAQLPGRPWSEVPVSTVGPVRIGDVRADFTYPITVLARASGAGVPPGVEIGIPLPAPPGGAASGNLVFSYASDAGGTKTKDGGPTWIVGERLTLTATADCFAPGFLDIAGPLAEQRLELGSEATIERYLWSLWGKAAAEKGAQDVPANATILDGLRRLDVLLRRCLGGVGTIHLPAAAAYCLSCADVLREREVPGDSGRWRYVSPLGTPITFGTGFDEAAGPTGMAVPAGQTAVYATGPVVIRRGPVLLTEQLDQWTNQYVAVAERVVGLSWDCCFLSGVISQCGGCDCPT